MSKCIGNFMILQVDLVVEDFDKGGQNRCLTPESYFHDKQIFCFYGIE